MKNRIKIGLVGLLSAVSLSACSPESNFSFQGDYIYFPYAIMVDTTSVNVDNAKYRIDTMLNNYFKEDKTAFTQSYGGSGHTTSEVMTQIYSQVGAQFKKEVTTIQGYDYNAILGESASFFTGTVDIGYAVGEHSTGLTVVADTVVQGIKIGI